jgi:hypothetical protein
VVLLILARRHVSSVDGEAKRSLVAADLLACRFRSFVVFRWLLSALVYAATDTDDCPRFVRVLASKRPKHAQQICRQVGGFPGNVWAIMVCNTDEMPFVISRSPVRLRRVAPAFSSTARRRARLEQRESSAYVKEQLGHSSIDNSLIDIPRRRSALFARVPPALSPGSRL